MKQEDWKMKENVAYLLGIVAGVAAVGIICWVKKRGRKETDYDERERGMIWLPETMADLPVAGDGYLALTLG